MDGKSIIYLISDYGITLVIVGIFVYVIIRCINLAFSTIEKRLGKVKHDEQLDLRDQIGRKVQYLINTFLESHDGHRVQVIEFSNSVMSVAYLPFRYMTCTYEVCTLGEHGCGKIIDRLSTSLFTQFFDNLQYQDHCIFDISNHNKLVGGAMYDLLKDMSEQRCICTMLRTAKGAAIGYIAFYKTREYSDQDKEDILTLRDNVESLLCVVKDNNKNVLN